MTTPRATIHNASVNFAFFSPTIDFPAIHNDGAMIIILTTIETDSAVRFKAIIITYNNGVNTGLILLRVLENNIVLKK